MTELKCKDGTVIKISDETEAELRKAFGPRPPKKYKDDWLEVGLIDSSFTWPISISIHGEEITRTIKSTKALIVALQEVVEYCKQHRLGL